MPRRYDTVHGRSPGLISIADRILAVLKTTKVPRSPLEITQRLCLIHGWENEDRIYTDVRKALTRLLDQGKVKRVGRGEYLIS
jgi:hypothetical protein